MKYAAIFMVMMTLATAMHADKVCIRVSDDVVYCSGDGEDEYIYTFGD